MSADRPRYTQDDFPPYSYVPGHAPHPVSHPDGHMHGEPHEVVAALQADAWNESATYLYGIDLFNHGYYWEAHEAWEALWHAAGRRGVMADFLKGLIKLAAAAVKAREGNPRGVGRHAVRAMQLLPTASATPFCGLDIARVLATAKSLEQHAGDFDQPQPNLLLDEWLELDSN